MSDTYKGSLLPFAVRIEMGYNDEVVATHTRVIGDIDVTKYTVHDTQTDENTSIYVTLDGFTITAVEDGRYTWCVAQRVEPAVKGGSITGHQEAAFRAHLLRSGSDYASRALLRVKTLAEAADFITMLRTTYPEVTSPIEENAT